VNRTVIQVPGEPTMWRTHDVSPVYVQIPLLVFVRRGPMLAFATFMALLSAACILGTISLAIEIVSNTISFSTIPVALGLIISLTMSVYGPCITLTSLSDASRTSPSLILENGDVHDLRTDSRIPWSNVDRIRLLHTRGGGVSGAVLKLHDPVSSTWNPFRIGSSGSCCERTPWNFILRCSFRALAHIHFLVPYLLWLRHMVGG